MFPVRENMVASPFLLSCSGRRSSANEVCTAPAMTPRLASAALPSTCYIQPSLFLDYLVLAKQASTNDTNRSTALTHSCVCAKKPFMKRSILFVTRYLSRDYITHARTHAHTRSMVCTCTVARSRWCFPICTRALSPVAVLSCYYA